MIDTKALRQKILDLAMRGKLVPQDSNDEPVENLLARIKEERHRLEKEKKISKVVDSDIFWSDDDNCYYEKSNSEENSVDDIPYDIPEKWTWSRFGALANIQTGATFSKETAVTSEKPNYIRVLRGGNISPFKWTEKYDDLFIPRELVKEGILLRMGDIITPAVTSLENVGKFGLVEFLLFKETTVGGFVFLIRPHLSNQTLSKYLFYILSSDELIASIKSITKKSGSAFYNINKEAFKNILFPIPPLQEQQRIVAKLDELFSLINKIEKEQEELEEYKKLAKEKVLELAVTGKLVKQDPNDEPASVLLERIKKEKEALIKAGKIKKDKTDNEPLSDDDKNYYGKLPKGWASCSLSKIIKEIKAGGDKPNVFSTSKTDTCIYPVIANGLENDGIVGYSNIASVDEDCLTISARGTIGMPTKRDYPFFPIVRLIVITFLKTGNIIDYVKIFLDVHAIKSTGTSIQQLTVPQAKSMIINLPPINEQNRIVLKIEKLEHVLK